MNNYARATQDHYQNLSQRYIQASTNLTPSRRYVNKNSTRSPVVQKKDNELLGRLISTPKNLANTPTRKVVPQNTRVLSPYVQRNQINLLRASDRSVSNTPTKTQNQRFNVNVVNPSRMVQVENKAKPAKWKRTTPLKQRKPQNFNLNSNIGSQSRPISRGEPTGKLISLLDRSKSPARKFTNLNQPNTTRNKNHEVRYMRIGGASTHRQRPELNRDNGNLIQEYGKENFIFQGKRVRVFDREDAGTKGKPVLRQGGKCKKRLLIEIGNVKEIEPSPVHPNRPMDHSYLPRREASSDRTGIEEQSRRVVDSILIKKFKNIEPSLAKTASRTVKIMSEHYVDSLEAVLSIYNGLSDPKNIEKMEKWPKLEAYVEEQVTAVLNATRINMSNIVCEVSKGILEDRFSIKKFEGISNDIIESQWTNRESDVKRLIQKVDGANQIVQKFKNLDFVDERDTVKTKPRGLERPTGNHSDSRSLLGVKKPAFQAKVEISSEVQRSRKTPERRQNLGRSRLNQSEQHFEPVQLIAKDFGDLKSPIEKVKQIQKKLQKNFKFLFFPKYFSFQFSY